MSSRKETKLLVEAFRLFLKEAPKKPNDAQMGLDFTAKPKAQPAAETSKVVRICDFDGAVAMRPGIPSSLNAFYQAILNKRGQALMDKKYPLQRNTKVDFNPATDYIVSSFKSLGSAAADIGSYVNKLLAKEPPDAMLGSVIYALTGESPKTKDDYIRLGSKILYRGASTVDSAVEDAPSSKSEIISNFLGASPSHVKIVSNKTGDNKESGMKEILTTLPAGTKVELYDNNEKDLKQMGIAAISTLGRDYVSLFLVDERGLPHHYESATMAKK